MTAANLDLHFGPSLSSVMTMGIPYRIVDPTNPIRVSNVRWRRVWLWLFAATAAPVGDVSGGEGS